MSEVNILITGASGFIGKALTNKLLSLNYNILALSRNNLKKYNKKNITWLTADLNNLKNIKDEIRNFKPEIIIHLSWENIPIFNLDNSLKNLNNSIDFFEFIFSLDTCKKILVSGSCLEYSKSTGICYETEVTAPNNYFTWAKNSLRSWLEIETLKNKCKFAWFRIFYVYGPNQRNEALIPSLINIFSNRKPISLNNIHNANDYIYIDDVIDGFISFLKLNVISGIYNLGTGKTTPTFEISYIIEDLILGSTKRTDNYLEIEKNTYTESTNSFFADTKTTSTSLGWKAKKTIKEGIKKTLNHYSL
jgi:UDP-glucuronate decarboxylase